MGDQLPPLNALRAFDQAGKHLSIARAAQELGVSSGAISQQVHALEKWIGSRLFNRNNRGLEFTEAGKAYYTEISDAMEHIRLATRRVGRPDIRKGLVISATASFAMKFLLPRLTRFREKWPNVDISINTVELVSEYHPQDGDLGIRYGQPQQTGMWCREILKDELILVASPNFDTADLTPTHMSALSSYPLLIDRHQTVIKDYPSWEQYFAKLKLDVTQELSFREFSQQWMVIEAAINGEGIALAKRCLVQNDLDTGRLQALSDEELSLDAGYYMLTLPENANDPVIRSFWRWIQEEVATIG
jgi:LysR family transcriptional regulator, glycine cleavage system transcriptional activator